MDFNINECVRVRLTHHGRMMLAENDRLFWERHGPRPESMGDYTPPKEDEDGWSKWQLWALMEALGPHITLSGPNCFDTTIQIVEPKKEEQICADPMEVVRSMCR